MIFFFESEDKERVVRFFYENESEQWHHDVHKMGGTVEENIQSTLSSISPKSIFYEVFEGLELAGFFVKYETVDGKVLEGFHVGKKYRTADFLKEYWDLIKRTFDGSFYCGTGARNHRALKHLEKQGFKWRKDVVENGKLLVVLEYNP